jgi:hypothetical protein
LSDKRLNIVLPAIVVAALLLRLAVRLHSWSADFWRNGYSFYFELARNIAAGRGLAFDGEPLTAFRVPIYPMFLAAVTLGHKAFLSVVFAQSLIGATTVLCGALLTAELFGSTAGITTAALAAAYPYYVVHDTALQDTSVLVTAVFFGHTSHRSFLDVYWMAYTSSVLTRWLRPAETAARHESEQPNLATVMFLSPSDAHCVLCGARSTAFAKAQREA